MANELLGAEVNEDLVNEGEQQLQQSENQTEEEILLDSTEETPANEEGQEAQEEEQELEEEHIKTNDPVGLKKRIGKLVFKQKLEEEKRIDAERRELMLQQELFKMQAQLQQIQPANNLPGVPHGTLLDPRNGEPIIAPNPKNFGADAWQNYVVELDNYNSRKAFAENYYNQQRLQQQEKQAVDNSYNQKAIEFSKKATDFNSVVNGALSQIVASNEAMLTGIKMAERGAELAYYLGKNLNEADRISKLNPVQALIELGKIESKLALPVKSKSSAPSTMKKVQSSNSLPAKDDFEAWNKYYKNK
ncbi:hypothetical protein E6Q11_01805 [Candidatus Dojkabacteria bacterium]|uniref:Uncharacterized protein n=1 Tax=Candidatus Dojkabacteria bacterium TaxID=2099670 RepID=A0A5C7J8Y4_9BACT|nr:MAG: hypothetical protein E6Q11_01805 [Candidatus Dojkabacteria bacterium]